MEGNIEELSQHHNFCQISMWFASKQREKEVEFQYRKCFLLVALSGTVIFSVFFLCRGLFHVFHASSTLFQLKETRIAMKYQVFLLITHALILSKYIYFDYSFPISLPLNNFFQHSFIYLHNLCTFPSLSLYYFKYFTH